MKRWWVVSAIAVLALIGAYFAFWPSDDEAIVADAENAFDAPKPGLDFVKDEGLEGFDGGVRSLSGSVVDASGQPVAGAKVWVSGVTSSEVSCHECGVSAYECQDEHTILELTALLRKPEMYARLRETVTDAQGRFRFDSVPNHALKLGAHDLISKASVTAEIESDEDEVLLELQPVVTMRFIVSSYDDAPLAGARVLMFDPLTGEEWAATSAFDGAVEIETSASAVWAVASLDGYVTGSAMVMGEALMTLSPAIDITVNTVRGNKPIEASVQLSESADYEPSEAHHMIAKTQNGAARFSKVRASTYSVVARSGSLISAPTSVEAHEGNAEITLDLEQAGRLMVTIIDEQGEPALNVIATVQRDSTTIANLSTGPKGDLLVIGPLPLGTYVVSLSAEFETPLRMPTRSLEIVPGDTAVEIVLQESLKLKGRVLASDGKPVARARVEIDDELKMQSSISEMSGEDGAFEIEVPEPGSWHVVVQHAQGAADFKVAVPGPPVDIRLESRGCVHITISDSQGGTIADARSLVSDSAGHMVEEVLDARGEATVCGLADGSTDVQVWATGFLRGAATPTTRSGAVEQVRLTMGRVGALDGTVLDEAGQPVSGAMLMEGDVSVAYSNAKGEFRTDELEAGKTYSLHASQLAFTDGPPVSVTAPASKLEFRLKRRPSMVGRVVGTGGRPLTQFIVNGDGVENPEGRFTVPMSKEVSISALGYKSINHTVETETADLGDLVLEPQERITGVVIDGEGRPVAGATVSSFAFMQDEQTDARGVFSGSVTDEFKGAFDITASLRRLSARGKAKTGESVTLRLVAPTKVRGKVIGPDGKGRAVSIYVAGEMAEMMETVESAPDGSFTMELRPGPHSFTTRLNRASQNIDIHGESQEIVLGVPPGTCGVVIESESPLHEVRLIPAGATVEEDDLEAYLPGTIVLGPGGRGEGIPCGEYVVVANFDTGRAQETRSILGVQTRVPMQAPPITVITPTDEVEPVDEVALPVPVAPQ